MKDNKVVDQIRTLKYEFKTLSSKKPNDVLNEFKVKYHYCPDKIRNM